LIAAPGEVGAEKEEQMIVVIRDDGTICEDGDNNVLDFNNTESAQEHADEVAKEDRLKTKVFQTLDVFSGYRIESRGDYFHLLHHCGQTCEIEFSHYDWSVPWIKITCPEHGSEERKLWKATIAPKFIKEMHELNPRNAS
jgi:hypothetical protein